MAEFRCIKIPAFLLLALFLTAAVSGHHSPSLVVRDGDEASLPCQSVIEGRHECDSSDWIFSSLGSSNTPTLVQHGHVQQNLDRLSVTANCSLVIKNVTAGDVGFYTCRSFYKSGYVHGQTYEDANVYLFLVNMVRHDENEQRVKLSCSVRANRNRPITLKWLYDGKTVDEDNMVTQAVKAGGTDSSVTVTFPVHFKQFYELFKCCVRDDYTERAYLFTFSFLSSGEDATTMSTATRAADKESRTNLTAPDITKSPPFGWWLPVVAGSAALVTVVAVVVIIRYKRTEGEKAQVDDNAADREDDVSYAAVSYTKMTYSKALVPVHDEGDAVTYSTVKVSSSNGVCADPSDLYATINKAVR